MTSSSAGGSGRAYNERATRTPKLARRARAVAKKNVITRRDGSAFVLTLPTNDRFRAPNVLDKERGTVYAEYDGDALIPFVPMPDDLQVAEMAIVYAAQAAALPSNLQAWTAREAKKRGGNAALAAALVALEPDPAHAKTDHRNMLRKVEEWRQGKYKKAAGRNQRRVAGYVLKNARRLVIGVTGQWYMLIREGEELEGPLYRRFNSDPQDAEENALARASVLAEGTDYIYNVTICADRHIKAYAVYLYVCHGLHLEVEP